MSEWILPSNSNHYRLDDALRDLKGVEWQQYRSISHAKPGEIVYFYETGSQSICWKGEITAVKLESGELRFQDAPYSIAKSTGPAWSGTYVRIENLREYGVQEPLALYNLRGHGLKSVYSFPIRVSRTLSHYLREIDRQYDRAEKAAKMTPRELVRAAKKTSSKKPDYREFTSRQYERSPEVRLCALTRAKGICQLCGRKGPFRGKDGNPYLECHHIVWLSRGGEDSLKNTAALCPNCHRKMHVIEDPADIAKLKKLIK